MLKARINAFNGDPRANPDGVTFFGYGVYMTIIASAASVVVSVLSGVPAVAVVASGVLSCIISVGFILYFVLWMLSMVREGLKPSV